MKRFTLWASTHIDAGDVGVALIALGSALYSFRLALVVVGAIYLLREHPLRSWF